MDCIRSINYVKDNMQSYTMSSQDLDGKQFPFVIL